MIDAMLQDWQMWITLAIIACAIIFYSLDRFSLEIISVIVLVILLVFFHLCPVTDDQGRNILDASALLYGFASPGLFAILGLLIIGQGMFQSGALEYPTRALVAAYAKHKTPVVIIVFVGVMFISAFLNNTPVVVMFIPILAAIASQSGAAPSRFMIPLSFMSIFGGMLTVIGSSTNLLANDAYKSVTGNEIGFFDLFPIGIALGSIGAVYLLIASKWLLPDRRGPSLRGDGGTDGKQFIAQLEIGRNHPLIGQGSVAGLFPDLPDMTVRMIQRKDEVFLPPFDEITFRLNDTVIIAATRKSLTSLLKRRPEILAGYMSEVEIDEEQQSGELSMVEAIVAPGSRITGRSIAQIGFRYQTNCVILGIQRRSRMIRAEMNSIRLEEGDVLLILGDVSDIRALRTDRDIVILEYSMVGLPDGQNAARASIIFAGVVGLAAFNILPIAISAIAGAATMIATGCLNVRQASRAIDRRIFMLVGSALAMGLALEKTGGADAIGQLLVDTASQGGPVMLISSFFIICAMLTNVLSNNATAVLFTPIAVSAANLAGIDPLILVMTVIFGANCSFATPVAYQTNLLVMAPGHYKFSDFVKIGVPLVIITWIAFSIIAPIYFKTKGLL